MTIYEAAKVRLAALEKREAELQEQVKSAPSGKLIWTKGSRPSSAERWYINDGKVRYLPRQEKELALALLLKAKAEAELKDIASEKYGLSCLLHHPRHHHLESFSKHLSTAKHLVALSWDPSKEIAWDAVHFNSNPYPIAKPLHTTNGGSVRSKSELLIAQLLLSNHVPYRYEQELRFNQKSLYPDFTIQRPYDKKIIYWEHWGMIDQSAYRAQYHEKMEFYMQHGILPDENLICTYETAEHPLDIESVEENIQRHLLVEAR
jgi:hypothetical protein